MQNNSIKLYIENSKKPNLFESYNDYKVIIDPIEHITITHGEPIEGEWLIVSKKREGEKKPWSDKSYGIKSFLLLGEELTGDQDRYVSQNSFTKPRRLGKNIKHFKTLFVDIDYYKTEEYHNHTFLDMCNLILTEIKICNTLPLPNGIINSGRGLALIWLIEFVEKENDLIWRKAINGFINFFKKFGSDSKVSDPARVLRIAGTINSKSNIMVEYHLLLKKRYKLIEIINKYLTFDIKRETVESDSKNQSDNTKNKKDKSRLVRNASINSKFYSIFNPYSLIVQRISDLNKLVELRTGKGVLRFEGCREMMCFLYRYWSLLEHKDEDKALFETLKFNKSLPDPLSEYDVISATKSSVKMWKDLNGKQEDFDSEKYKRYGYNYTNKTLIRLFDIQSEEMHHLSTIINGKEKNRRNRILKENQRRAKGSQPREEKNRMRKLDREKKLNLVRMMIYENKMIKNEEISEKTGIPLNTVKQFKTIVNKELLNI